MELLGPAAGEQVRSTAISSRQPAAGRQTPPALPSGTQGGALQEAWSRTILERPLFSPSRRPSAAAAAAATAPPRLAGIIVGPAGDHAIFAGAGDARAILAGVGAQVGPYLIRAITADGIDVTGPNGKQHMLPHYDNNGPPTQAAGTPGQRTPPPPGTSILDMLRARLRPGGGALPAGAPARGGAMPGPFRPQVAAPAGSSPPPGVGLPAATNPSRR
ncbi:hypothetical protein [Lichenicoccus sp.]|uniref:hypothetical protein n=1 Tax=Lichenicoccus sp. TaxID=2781899 RepID=UPI003D1031FE